MIIMPIMIPIVPQILPAFWYMFVWPGFAAACASSTAMMPRSSVYAPVLLNADAQDAIPVIALAIDRLFSNLDSLCRLSFMMFHLQFFIAIFASSCRLFQIDRNILLCFSMLFGHLND